MDLTFGLVNLHCKSFKKKTRTLANFVITAMRTLSEQLGRTLHRRGNNPHKRKLHVIVVGDFNIDTRFQPELDREAQQAAVSKAPFGELPGEDAVLDLASLRAFCEELKGGGATFVPSMETMTTAKMRMCWQGQPEKAGELTIGHKDFVILPKGSCFHFQEVVLGGRDNPGDLKQEHNMDLLQPSYHWPGDHCAVLCTASVQPEPYEGEGDGDVLE